MSTDSLAGLALFGKTALALLLVIGLILLVNHLLKRLQHQQRGPGSHLRLVSSLAVGQRERVVIVELEDKWLVLGVGGGQVNKVDEFPAPAQTATPPGERRPASFGGLLRRLREENRS